MKKYLIIRYTFHFMIVLVKCYLTSYKTNNSLIKAQIIRRGLMKDTMFDFDNVESDTTDLALLSLNKEAPHIKSNEYFDPQLNSLYCKSNVNSCYRRRLHIFSFLLLSVPGCLSSFLRDDIVFDRISSLLLSCSSSLSRPSTHVIIYIHASLSHFFGPM